MVDITGPFLESEGGNSYVLVVGGLLQQVDGGVPYPRPGSHNGSSKLVDEVYCRFSPPEQLHSDQGRQLESELIGEICLVFCE